jgi:hypothetical protein
VLTPTFFRGFQWMPFGKLKQPRLTFERSGHHGHTAGAGISYILKLSYCVKKGSAVRRVCCIDCIRHGIGSKRHSSADQSESSNDYALWFHGLIPLHHFKIKSSMSYSILSV